MTQPALGPRQAAKLACDLDTIQSRLSTLRSETSGLEKQQTSLKTALLNFVLAAAPRERQLQLVAGARRFYLRITQKRSAVSYKEELLKHIDAIELTAIAAAQPLTDKLEFDAQEK